MLKKNKANPQIKQKRHNLEPKSAVNLNLNRLLVKRQIDNPSSGALTGGNKSIALTREVHLDTLSSDSSEEEIRNSGRSFQSLIVWGKKLYYRQGMLIPATPSLENKVICRYPGFTFQTFV